MLDRHSENRPCICGSTTRLPLPVEDRHNLGIEVCLCLSCGHIYVGRGLSESFTPIFYEKHYRDLYYGSEDREDEAVKQRKLKKAAEIVHPFATSRQADDSGRRVAEWGCSSGWNLVPFRDAGWTAVGFDYDVNYVAFGIENFGLDLRLVEGGEHTSPENRGAYDLIILNHVLEHAIDPIQMLQRLSAMLSDSGQLYIGLPLIENMDSSWYGHFHIAHNHYFSAASFERLARHLGFRVLDSRPEVGDFLLTRAGQETKNPALAGPMEVFSSIYAFYGLWYSHRMRPAIARRLGQG